MTRRAAALKHFRRTDPQFYAATLSHHATLPEKLPLKRTRKELFRSLVAIVISQQLGTAAADTIFVRVNEVAGDLTPLSLLRISPERLRTAGLSGAKIKTLKAIAEGIEEGSLDLLALKKIPEAEATTRLTKIWGLGPWSVEMFLMFALGREDVFSPGDLGLMRSMESLYGLAKNAPHASLLAIAERWAPYRTYAALLLWRIRDTKVDSGTR